jgi:hypothetical protein
MPKLSDKSLSTKDALSLKTTFAVSSMGGCQCKFDQSYIGTSLGGGRSGIHMEFYSKNQMFWLILAFFLVLGGKRSRSLEPTSQPAL